MSGIRLPIIIIAILSLLALYFPAINWLYGAWLHNEYYSYAILLLPLVILYLFIYRKSLLKPEKGGGLASYIVLALSASLYILALFRGDVFIMCISLLLTISGLSLALLGRQRTKVLLLPLLLFAIAIPIPGIEQFGWLLQKISSRGATIAANIMGLNASSSGNFITVNGISYEAALPCSGLNKFLPLLSLTLILVFMLEGHWLKKASLLALVLPFVIISNIIRITATLTIGSYWGPETAVGFFHQLSSIVLFVLTLGLIIFIARLLNIIKLRRNLINEP